MQEPVSPDAEEPSLDNGNQIAPLLGGVLPQIPEASFPIGRPILGRHSETRYEPFTTVSDPDDLSYPDQFAPSWDRSFTTFDYRGLFWRAILGRMACSVRAPRFPSRGPVSCPVELGLEDNDKTPVEPPSREFRRRQKENVRRLIKRRRATDHDQMRQMWKAGRKRFSRDPSSRC